MAASPSAQDIERFNSKVDRSGECHSWTGSLVTNGYGAFYWGGRLRTAHRVAWEIVNGPIPAGMCVCHHCDNPRCVNVAHLFLGTNRDNVADRVAKKRTWNGRRPVANRLPESLRAGVGLVDRALALAGVKS